MIRLTALAAACLAATLATAAQAQSLGAPAGRDPATAPGGTEGVGMSTTRTVVAVSIAILIADFLLTKLFIVFQAS